MTALLEHLESVRSAGRKIFVPYLMAGVPDPETFTALLSLEEADAIEVGLPFSDPLMDGPVIAAAGERAIADGIGPLDAIDLVAGAPKAGPLRLVMTYYNPIHHLGEEEFCGRLVAAGISGLIVPDLPGRGVGLPHGACRRARACLGTSGCSHLVGRASAKDRRDRDRVRLRRFDHGGHRGS